MHDYCIIEKEIIEFLEKNTIWVLATCINNHVTARSISIINFGLKIYFQTDSEMEKYKQIVENPNVALCYKNYQIEGNAVIKGNIDKNSDFLGKYRIVHKNSFEKYSHLKNEVVIEIKPSIIKIWKYIDDKPCIDFIDVIKKQVHRKYYL